MAMASEQPRRETPRETSDDGDFAEVAHRLQDQIDDLVATLEHHQRLFERLRAAGLLAGEDGRV